MAFFVTIANWKFQKDWCNTIVSRDFVSIFEEINVELYQHFKIHADFEIQVYVKSSVSYLNYYLHKK
jgi:hypothetical protein